MSERFHNAAVSLAFVLKTSVFVEQELNFRRQDALKDFLQLVDWASPQDWSVRTGMVQDLLRRLDDIVLDEALLIETVEKHQLKRMEGQLWGDLEVSKRKNRRPFNEVEEDDLTDYASMDTGEVLRRNSQWTEACTHSERGMGIPVAFGICFTF